MTVLTPTTPSRRAKQLARTAGLALAAVGVAGGAFLAVLHFQPAVLSAAGLEPHRPVKSFVAPNPPLHHGMGPGDAPWFNSYSAGKLSSQFRAEEYNPCADGSVDVLRPQARFFLGGGQRLDVTGETGKVAFDSPSGNAKDGLMTAGSKVPQTGQLHHVHIELFPSSAAARPTLTMDTDNVRFDNDTLRLFTEAIPATATAAEVAADRVPVVVRGVDYDMDGTGLTLRLSEGDNPGDRQLHLLEIAHGRRLTLLHPGTVGGSGNGGGAAPHAAPVPTAQPAIPPSVLPVPPAGATHAAGVPKPAAVPATAPVPPTLYRAVFRDNVRVAQGTPGVADPPEQTIGLGDVLTIDLLQKASAPKPPTPAQAATPSATPPPPPTTAPAAAPAPGTAAVVATAAPPASQPAGTAKFGSEPITVYWTGTLRVTPIDPATAMMPLTGGQSAVRLAGRPATLSYNGANARAAVATYRTVDDAVRLEPSPQLPTVHLSQPQKGMTLDAPSVVFDPVTSIATILGPATMRVADAARRSTMTATWADRGLLHVVNAGADPAGVDHVDLLGDVHVDDPRFAQRSRRLLLDLDLLPPTTRPAATTPGAREQLRRMTAVGDVVCRLLRPGQPDQGIESDRLVIGMAAGPDGSVSPRTVVADGRQVRAFDADQALHADHLEAVLAPKPASATTRATATTKPSDDAMAAVALGSLYATGHVRAALKDGATTTSDALRETTAADGRQLVELTAPGGARVVDAKHDVLVGSVLHVSDRGVVVVDGPGTLHTTGKPTPQPAAKTAAAGGGGGRPMDVSWTDGLTFDQNANTVDVVGRVLVRSTNADGTVTVAVGDTAHLDLLDNAKDAKPTDGDALGSKALRKLTLAGHMTATSRLEMGGVVLRFGQLKGDRLVYTAADGLAHVPGAGTLLVENHPQPATGTAAVPAGGKFGVMAVGWKGGLVYDTLADRITITGDTRVGFQQDVHGSTAGGPIQMRSDQLLIVLQKTTGADQGKTEVSQLLATGAVHAHTRTMDMDCHTGDFDPRSGLLVATGSDAEPGRATDAASRGMESVGGRFDQMRFDTNKQEVVGGRNLRGSFRH